MSFSFRAAALSAVLLVVIGTGFTGRPRGPLGPLSEHAMVVAAHPVATAIGVQVLREGGNAIDAAVAVHFALAVVSPWAGNIGGGGFMLVRSGNGHVMALDFREKAPQAATHNMYLDSTGMVVPKLSTRGHLAAGVPGAVAGLFAMHDSLGRMPMSLLIQPAINLALKGVRLTAHEARELDHARADMERFSTMPSAYTSRSRWKLGDTLVQPELAATLMRIRDNGPAGFYAGETADLIVAEMRRGKGLIGHEDLEAYQPVWRTPVHSTFRGLDVYGMPPPSSGGIALAQLLQAMEQAPPGVFTGTEAERIHYMVEIERRVFADRATHLGDPDFLNISTAALVDPYYVQRKMADIDRQRATSSSQLLIQPPCAEHDQTTHFSIVDGLGNAVSITTTLNGNFGSCLVVGGAGFVLNNEMDDFRLKPSVPNAVGVLSGSHNTIAPNKRMLSSMSPTILAKDGDLFMVLGTPGGSTIISTVFQTILNVVDHGMTMQEAVAAPRFHHQWLPDTVHMEPGCFGKADSVALVLKGHTLVKRNPYGRVDAIRKLPDGTLEGGADPRGEDAVGGF
jgi:gamma-glutamyltranspeptidase/glutathione hydrolase